ncbi:MAG: pyridoxal-phosphate dependent enzyme [Rhodospirillales bacterium]|nr:pyridoxal-phosphate dependent enzyme [Alphaproteobacteria bacterium]USO04249.1 MAG: pyridoxal-phosphate dependent enzyme [Rhodospirillales bacterium]
MIEKLEDQLFEEILRARTRVYRVGNRTPLQEISNDEKNYQIFIKREDLGPINAYKWRGAYNAVLIHHEQTGCQTVVAASAGNHAQGVALAARELGLTSKIFMPESTPMMKQKSVKRHGGDTTEIILIGDTYNEAGKAAKAYCEKHKYTYIHPFDDLYTIAGQATIADEIMLSGKGPFDYAFVQIGGGGMAAAVSSWLKIHNPDIKIIGVEGVDQACMKASIEAGKPVTLENVDTFCDGTAVTRPGDLTFDICRKYIDAYITVTNEEVSAAIARMWEASRVIPEPAGAMGLAGVIQFAENNPDEVQDKKMLSILCGANMDFSKLSLIASRSAIGAHRHYLRFHLNEEKGGLLNLLDKHFKDVNVSEFLYGKVDEKEAWPIIALEATPAHFATLKNVLNKSGTEFEDVTMAPDVRYRIINYNPALFKAPLLMHVHFPERKSALRDFLRNVSGIANVCYFNYAYSGEAIGRALMGFEFESQEQQKEFEKIVQNSLVTCRPVDESTAARILQ